MLDPNQFDLLESISDAIVIVNDEGRIIFVNAPFSEQFGYPQNEIIGKPVELLLPERFTDSHAAHRQSFMEQPRKRQMGEMMDLFARHQDGREIPVRISLSPRQVEARWEVICILEDLTPRTQLEAQNRVQVTALEATANAIVITDTQGNITWVNPAFTRLTGYSFEEAVGETPRVLKSGYHDEKFYQRLWEKIVVGKVWHGKVINRRKSGEVYTEEMTITPVKGPQGQITHYIAIKQDVSEQVAREVTIQKLYKTEREQKELSEALHEVSTSLNSELDVERLLDELLAQIERVVPFDSGKVFLREDDHVYIARHRGYQTLGEAALQAIEGTTLDIETTGNLRQMWSTGEPLIIPSTGDYEGWIHVEGEPLTRSWMGVPISARGEVLGFLSLDKKELDFYQPSHAHNLAAFANQAALALQNAQLLAEERRRIQELEALRATAADISAELGLSNLLLSILERAADLLDAAGGELGLYEKDTEQILVVISQYPGQDYAGTRLSLGEGAMGHIAKTREPLNIKNYATWEGRSAQYLDVSIRPLIGAPLLAGNRLVGVITVADPNPEKIFDESDQNLLTMFAQQAAIAVENAHLFEDAQRQAQEAETLRQASAIVTTSLKQDEAIDRILDSLDRVVPHDSASVQLLREGYTEIVGGRGWPDPEAVLGTRFAVPGDTPNARVIESRQPHILAHVDFSDQPNSSHIKSWLGVPLIVRDKTVGMLALDSLEPDYFTNRHATLVTAFADQVAIALENARLFEDETRRAEELSVLHAIAQASAEATQEGQIIETATRLIGEALSLDFAGISLVNPQTKTLHLQPSPYLPSGIEAGHVTKLGEGVSGDVAQDGLPRRIGDITKVENYLDFSPSARSELCVPLKSGNEVIGVINCESVKLDAFDSEDENLLLTISRQVATGIEKVRLYRSAVEAAERRAVLYQASQEIGASLQPDQIYTAIHRAADQLMPCEVFVIALLDRDEDQINAAYLSEKGIRYPARQVPKNQGMSGYVISSGKPLRSGQFDMNFGREIGIEMFGDGDNVPPSILAVPMRLGTEITGMLSAQSFEINAYSADDQEALESMAIQAAIALNNSQLFESTRRQVEELMILEGVSAAGAAATNEQDLIEKATQLISASIYTDSFGFLLMDETAGLLKVHPSYRGLDRQELEKEDFHIPLGQGITGEVALTGKPRRIPDVTLEPGYLSLVPNVRSELCVPIIGRDQVIGVLNAESSQVDTYRPADERLLVLIANQLATAIEKVRLFEKNRELAITDSLTQLANRRYFFEQAEREFARAKRYDRPLATIMFDLDRFKRVNDTYGHAVGDQVLQAIGRRCARDLRKIDLLARYGGEEFIALLPECSLAAAKSAAERLCQSIHQATFDTNAGPVRITISLGAAEMDATCTSLDELLHRADRALYQAKQSGRNRVCLWE